MQADNLCRHKKLSLTAEMLLIGCFAEEFSTSSNLGLPGVM